MSDCKDAAPADHTLRHPTLDRPRRQTRPPTRDRAHTATARPDSSSFSPMLAVDIPTAPAMAGVTEDAVNSTTTAEAASAASAATSAATSTAAVSAAPASAAKTPIKAVALNIAEEAMRARMKGAALGNFGDEDSVMVPSPLPQPPSPRAPRPVPSPRPGRAAVVAESSVDVAAPGMVTVG